MDEDEAVERWLREEVVPAVESYKADPSRALTSDQVRESLAEKRKQRSSDCGQTQS